MLNNQRTVNQKKASLLGLVAIAGLIVLTACSQTNATPSQSEKTQQTSEKSSGGQTNRVEEDRARKSRIQSEHRQLVSAMQAYFGDKLVDDQASVIDALDSVEVLEPYLALQEGGSVSDALAKNPDGSPAHTLTDGQLSSTWKSSVSDDEEFWTYDINPSTTP